MWHLLWQRLSLIFAMTISLSSSVYAHEPGLSAATLRLADGELAAHLTFSRREIETLVPIDTNHNGLASVDEFDSARPHLSALASRLLEITSDHRPLAARVVAVRVDASDALHIHLAFPEPTGSPLRIYARSLGALSRGHRQHVSVYSATGNQLANHILDAKRAGFELALAEVTQEASPWPFRQFLYLGVEHIVTGYDHLLFLFALLVVCSNLWGACRIITSFTLAHSMTLALATFNWVRLSSNLVEPLIAVSIIYVGLENLWCRDRQRREWLTFGFGLIHGLGFASILRELGIGASGSNAVIPLLAFNLGVELGQVAIALVLLPVIGQAQRLPHVFPRVATTASVLVILAGSYWLLVRTI